MYIAATSLVTKILLNLALIPYLGIFGASLAYFVTGLQQAYLVNRFSQRLMPVSYPYNAMWRIALLAALAYVASLGIDYRHMESSIPLKLGLVAAYLLALYTIDKQVRWAVARAFSRVWKNRST